MIAINQRDILNYVDILSNLVNCVYCIDDASIVTCKQKVFVDMYHCFPSLLVECRNRNKPTITRSLNQIIIIIFLNNDTDSDNDCPNMLNIQM